MKEPEKYQPKVLRRKSTLQIRGVNYNINHWGDEDAPTLFYLHGWADTGSAFQFVVDELLPGWQVLAPDWRGFGESSLQSAAYWFPDYLADLYEILDHYSPGTPVRLVGHSMGGNIASLYAGSFPERVSDLVNIEGFGLADSDPGEAPRRYRAWIEAAQSDLNFTSYADDDELAARIARRNPGMTLARAKYVADLWAKAGADGRVKLRIDVAHRLPNAVLYRRAEAEACWRNITARILLILGADSQFATHVGGAGELPFPNKRICTLEATGHMIHFEAPVELAAAIDGFLRKPL